MKPYACHNRKPFVATVVVQDGWHKVGVTRMPRMVEVPFRMARDCQYRDTVLGMDDKRCNGCERRAPALDAAA